MCAQYSSNSAANPPCKYSATLMASLRTSQPALAADPSKPHLILVGLPGSGKTTVGALLASRLGRGVLDFDQEISRREGMSVSEIFAMRGSLSTES